ncbi:MAG: hypothetical protein M1819_004360 [Sarea resinae]|nr:MAG: hypothetical protein M1819_004360 [Sarea resinae]
MSAPAVPESTEARELSLVGKVELRVALADTDSKFESILKTFLPPLLLKLASEHVSVRNKVISVCQHINTRIKPPSIKLPVLALLQQFKSQPASPLVRHFDLLYIQQGLGRLPVNERIELLPIVIHGLAADASNSAAHGSRVFNLFLRLLPYLSLPPRGSKEDLELRERLGLSDRQGDANFIAYWCGKVVLLALSRSSVPTVPESAKPTCPGLSVQDYDFLTLQRKQDTWNPSADQGLNLTETKIAVLNFIRSGAFTEEERFFPALIAAADSNSLISDIGEDILKRSLAKISLEDGSLVETMFAMYFGSQSPEGPPAVLPALKIRILMLLSKSVKASEFTGSIRRLVREGIMPSEANEAEQYSTASLGREASKLRSTIFSFITWVVRMGDESDLETVAPELVSQLIRYIENQGWPNLNTRDARSTAELPLRGYAYETIGLLARASPKKLLMDPNIDLVRWLFRSLSEESWGGNVSLSIEEALGSILGPLSGGLDVDVEGSLRSLLLHHMELDLNSSSEVRRSTRFVSVRFANRCLPYRDVTARWIDLLAIGSRVDERNEVIEEGKRGLDPYWYRNINSGKHEAPSPGYQSETEPRFQFPDFAELTQYIFGNLADQNSTEIEGTSLFRHFRGPRIHAFAFALGYCRRVLITQAVASSTVPVTVDADWEQRVDAATTTDFKARQGMKKYLSALDARNGGVNSRALLTYLSACFEGLTWNHGEGIDKCGEYFAEISGLSTDNTIRTLAARAPALVRPIFSNRHTTRIAAAHAFGVLSSHDACSQESLLGPLNVLLNTASSWKEAVGSDVNKTHGAIIALAYFYSRLSYRKRKLESFPPIQVFLTQVLHILVDSRDSLLLEASYLAIDQLSLFSIVSPDSVEKLLPVASIIESLSRKARLGEERAIITLGHFAMIFDEKVEGPDMLHQILDQLYSLHEVRQPEIHFAVGDALSCAAIGWSSKSLMAALDIEGSQPVAAPRENTLKETLERVLQYCKNTKPALRKIMSLASEVGDPSLVYRFMSLASNNALWSSRAAFGRFGLSNILSESTTNGYLAQNPKLYPKLFRYRFDPNPNVQRAMNDIWVALVKDPTATLTDHFDAIIQDLLKSVIGREWRVRQASCAAIADLVQGRPLEKVGYVLSSGQVSG